MWNTEASACISALINHTFGIVLHSGSDHTRRSLTTEIQINFSPEWLVSKPMLSTAYRFIPVSNSHLSHGHAVAPALHNVEISVLADRKNMNIMQKRWGFLSPAEAEIQSGLVSRPSQGTHTGHSLTHGCVCVWTVGGIWRTHKLHMAISHDHEVAVM